MLNDKKWKIQKRISMVFFLIIFGIYPLAMTNGYYNVTATKLGVFGFTILAVFFVCGWIAYMEKVKADRGFRIDLIQMMRKGTDRWIGLFLLANVIAFLCSKYRSVSFTGSTDTYLGLFYVVLLVMTYVVASRWLQETDKLVLILAVGMILVVLFALIQFLGYDPFALLTGLQTKHVYNYLSTLGNTAVYGEYLILMLPVISYAYCVEKNWKKRIIYGTGAAIGMIGIMITNTDAAYLGMVLVVILLAMITIGHRNKAMRYMELLICYAVGVFLMRTLYAMFPGARGVSLLTDKLMSAWKLVLIFSVAALAVRLLMQYVFKKDLVYQVLTWIIRGAFCLCVIAVICGFVYFSGINRRISFYGLEKYLRFSDEWGTERGYVWRWLASIWMNAGVVQKLFGAGQGSVVLELFTHYKKEMAEGLGYFFDNAHNVYLHLLTTTGLFGCISYIGVIISSVVEACHKGKRGHADSILPGIAIAVIVYSIQDVVSILQPITWCLLILYVGLLAKKEV